MCSFAQNKITRRPIHFPLIVPKAQRDVSVYEQLPYASIIPPSQHALGKNTLGSLLYSSVYIDTQYINVELPIQRTCMSIDCTRRKPTQPKERPCKRVWSRGHSCSVVTVIFTMQPYTVKKKKINKMRNLFRLDFLQVRHQTSTMTTFQPRF